MEINGKSINFLSYTSAKKSIQETVSAETLNSKADTNYLNYQYTDDSVKVFDVDSIGSTLSDKAIEKLCRKTLPELSPAAQASKLATTYKDLSPANITKIKEVIYALHNPDPGTPDNPVNPPQGEKKSFISEFGDTETMFEYLHNINPAISKEYGITRSQLVALTQDDNWEDSNNDFFGSLNRIFDKLDKNGDDVLSYSEINTFIGEELGEDVLAYQSKVQNYTNQIQQEYHNLSNQEKLEFAIDKTREYLEASGMQEQLDALDRLLGMEDRWNSIKVGQIAIADLNKDGDSDWVTLGAYTPYTYQMSYEKDGKTYGISIFATDEDMDTDPETGVARKIDLGITLDISLLDKNWYELVNVLVHELTHATAYKYSAQDGSTDIVWDGVEQLYNLGYISDAEYNWYDENWSEDWTDAQIKRLYYLMSCAWGEYTAYQADADYLDSVAGDVYDKHLTTSADGADEKQVIIDHVNASYNVPGEPEEAYPDFKWWSYA